MKIACVGEATADRVRAFGVSPELVPSGEQSSLGLLDEFPEYDSIFDPVNRVLLPRADIATETLAEGLRDRGWEIEDVTAYRTVRAAPPPAETREMIKTGGSTPSASPPARRCATWSASPAKPHARTIVACIGPKTAETAAEFGLRVDVQPRPPRWARWSTRWPSTPPGCVPRVRCPRRARRAGAANAECSHARFPLASSAPAEVDPRAAPVGGPDILEPRHLVLPMFVADGIAEPRPISSMPGVVQHTRDSLRQAAAEAVDPVSAG